MMIKGRKKEGGFISAELGIGIFVVSILGIGGFMIGKSLSDSSKIDQAVTDHTVIVKNIENLERSGVYLPNLADNAMDSSVLLSTMRNPADTAETETYLHKFGQAVTATGDSATNSYSVTYEKVPANACVEFASRIANMHSTSGADFSDVLVGTTQITGIANMEATLTTACEAATDADGISIVAKYDFTKTSSDA